MKRNTLLKTGIIGSIIAALCCFTPVLVILLGAVGLAASIGYLDYVLMPALVMFIGITAYAYFLKRGCKGGEGDECKP
ncbi:MAG: mercury resistance system transport protein MerF [Thermodesulfobacteriota bacterium]